MSDDPMDGPFLKVERANYHIGELETIFRRYIAANAESMAPKQQLNPGHLPIGRFGTEFPRSLPAVIGDAIHNLRVSLDHAYWILVEDNGGIFGRYVKFPFGGNFKSIEGSLKGQPAEAKPKQAVIDFILNELEPFPGGRHELYDLHALDITDKHKLLIPTRLAIHLTQDRILTMKSGSVPIRMVGHAEGTTLISTLRKDGSVMGGVGWNFEYSSDLQDALSILFGEGEFQDRAVLDTLRTLSKNVASAIRALGIWHSAA